MKKLININEIIKSLSGLALIGLDQETFTYKKALIAYCELFRPETTGSGEQLRAFNIGIKLYDTKDEIVLDDDEIEFLKKIINSSSAFISTVPGRLIQYLDSAKNCKE